MRILATILLIVANAGAALKNADHWSYHPTKKIADGSVDKFIRQRLESEGLAINAMADRRTLIRRLTFDLHGLPPTPKEIEAYLNDESDQATKKLIDRLLSSWRYGERWARHWLDVVRFSESQGFERDKIRPDAWHYRDYVINSFNSDKPYDQFVREQIAGDVIKPLSSEGIIATGFLVAGPWDEVGNGQKSNLMRMRVREEELEDIISAVGQTFLGVTINCARCHDHKFDPIPQQDYYAIKAVFEGVFHGSRTYLTPDDVKQRELQSKQIFAKFVVADRRRRELKHTAIQKLSRQSADGESNLKPYYRWTFDGDTTDLIRGLPGYLFQGAKMENGRLILDGKAAHMKTAPLPTDVGVKTLESWVKLTDLDQRKGAVVSLYQDPGSVFDAIVYGERRPRAWMVGSDYFKRTVDQANEEKDDESLIHMVVSYALDNSIALYRNGELLGKYTPKHPLQKFDAKKAFLYFGRRTRSGYLKGEIEEVRMYDRALSATEVKQSFEAGPILYSAEQLAKTLSPSERKEYPPTGKRVSSPRN